MKEHSRVLKRPWMLPAGVAVFVAGHVILFDRLHYAGVPVAVVSGLVLLMIAKHLGVLGPLYALFRRRSRS